MPGYVPSLGALAAERPPFATTLIPPHVHHKEDEGFWVLEDEVTFDVGGTTIVVTVGD